MTTTARNADFAGQFPDGIVVGTPAFNKIAAMNSMFDFITKGDPTWRRRLFQGTVFQL